MDIANAALRSLDDAARYLEGLINVEKRPDWPYRRFSLDPIEALLARLGQPQRDLRVLHVAGSKGKGSVALFSESILRAAGRRTGTFTSPHLECWTERFRIDGLDVTEEALVAAVARVRETVEAQRCESPELMPTFFDVTTAVAFLLFADAGVDWAIVEVGLGGRLDSTNVCSPAVACVTSIELEHTDRLGDTLAAIAGEKAGIAKSGVPLVVGDLPPDALAVVASRATEVGAPMVLYGREFVVDIANAGFAGARVDWRDDGFSGAFDVPQLGAAAPVNAALAVACVRHLEPALGRAALTEAVRTGFAQARLPGRIEVWDRSPTVLIDGAHTLASARALAGVLAQLEGPLDFLLSVSAGKDIDGMLAVWLDGARSVTTTQADRDRSIDAVALAKRVEAIAPTVVTRVEPDAVAAVQQARQRCDANGVLCIAGSIYLAGIARRVLATAADRLA